MSITIIVVVKSMRNSKTIHTDIFILINTTRSTTLEQDGQQFYIFQFFISSLISLTLPSMVIFKFPLFSLSYVFVGVLLEALVEGDESLFFQMYYLADLPT